MTDCHQVLLAIIVQDKFITQQLEVLTKQLQGVYVYIFSIVYHIHLDISSEPNISPPNEIISKIIN